MKNFTSYSTALDSRTKKCAMKKERKREKGATEPRRTPPELSNMQRKKTASSGSAASPDSHQTRVITETPALRSICEQHDDGRGSAAR